MTRARRKPDAPDLEVLTVNSTALAGVLGISQRRVHQLAADGIIPKPVGFRYPLAGSVRGYTGFLRAIVEQQGSGSSNADLKAARVALLKAQKRASDLAYDERAGKLLSIGDAEALMLEAAASFAGQKRSMGSRLAGQLAGMSDPKQILALLNKENDAILRTVAEVFRAKGDYAAGKRQ